MEQNEIEIKETFSEKIMQLIINKRKKVKKKKTINVREAVGKGRIKQKKIVVYKIFKC